MWIKVGTSGEAWTVHIQPPLLTRSQLTRQIHLVAARQLFLLLKMSSFIFKYFRGLAHLVKSTSLIGPKIPCNVRSFERLYFSCWFWERGPNKGLQNYRSLFKFFIPYGLNMKNLTDSLWLMGLYYRSSKDDAIASTFFNK